MFVLSHGDAAIEEGDTLHLSEDAAAGEGPLLRDGVLVDALAEDAAGGPVLHEGAGSGLVDAGDVEDGDAAQRVEHALVVAAVERVALRQARLLDAALRRRRDLLNIEGRRDGRRI